MAPNSAPKKKGIGCLRIALIIIFVPIIVLAGFIFFSAASQNKPDAEVLKSYKPTAEIADIAEKDTLTDKGKATLFRVDPQIVDAQTFATACRTEARGVEALACVAPKLGGGPFGGKQIFLLKIDDPRFSDHKYAAAAHEMLHRAYARLSSDEKKRLVPLLEQELEKYKDDAHLAFVVQTLRSRKTNTEENVLDELHSKFGVEYSNLSPELEEYYKQYFNDRTKVIELYKNGGFDSRVRRMDEIHYQINTLAPQITAYQNAGDVANYNTLVGQYNALAEESQRIYSEVQEFYKYFNPEYKSPSEKAK